MNRGGRSGFLRLVALVARRDYLRTVRRRGFVLGTLLLPLSIGFFFLVSSIVSTSQIDSGPDPSSVTLVVVDESPVELTNDLVPTLQLLDRQTAEAQDAFEARAVAEPCVAQCWRMASGADFVLVLQVRDMPHYLQLAARLFTQAAKVRNVNLHFATRRAKFETKLPLAQAQ